MRIIENDTWLTPYSSVIEKRHLFKKKMAGLTSQSKDLKAFATGHLYFGVHRTEDGVGYQGVDAQCNITVPYWRIQQLETGR